MSALTSLTPSMRQMREPDLSATPPPRRREIRSSEGTGAAASCSTGARALVERTTIPRGLPVCVEDPVALARVATLLAVAERPPRVAAGQRAGTRS